MALVMLPCDLPWWPGVTKQLDRAGQSRTSGELVDAMQRIHDTCNISLDPEEDVPESNLFDGLVNYLDQELSPAEREHIFKKTLPRIASRAKALKTHKPPQGLHFSLQQQGDTIEHSYAFVASLIANAFFSTYPKRTTKTHPTLKDFNFTNFFKHLHLNSQKAKLRSIFHYFDFLEQEHALEGRLLISRQVLVSKQWLTIEDWLESGTHLCPLAIRHEGRLERCSEASAVRVCFSSRSLGNGVLEAGVNQESIQVVTHPELLAAILSVEALEDNEALFVEGLRQICRIQDPKNRATFEAIPKPNTISVCCIDAEDYSRMTVAQYEEDNVLRELNKSLLGFRQRRPVQSPTADLSAATDDSSLPGTKRLSPIGESFSSPSPECEDRQKSSTFNDKQEEPMPVRVRGNGTSVTTSAANTPGSPSPPELPRSISANRRNRTIVLGSSGEALPVTRKSIAQTSVYDSLNSQSTDSFHSAKDTIDEEPEIEDDEQKLARRYSSQLDTPERRGNFAQRLKEALRREHESTTSYTTTSVETSSESSYAVGISVSGSHVADQNIIVKRGVGSTGFVLRDEMSVDEEFLKESLEAEQKWLGRFRQNHSATNQRKDASASSRYSFSSEYSSDFCSELEEVYEQLTRWMEEPLKDKNASGGGDERDARDRAVVTFAGSLLKRALSESFAGVPVQEGEPQPLFDANDQHQKNKIALAVRSLSLELARQKSRRQPSIRNGTSNNHCYESEEEEDVFEDAFVGDLSLFQGTKKPRSKKLTVTFTSEIFQTLIEDEAVVCLPIRNEKKEKKVSRENSAYDGEMLPIATGNWGCGSSLKGDPQLKLVIQWLSASMAGVPKLIYYTYGHSTLTKLDTVSRVLTDRHWSVGDLAAATLRFSQMVEERREGRNSLFEELIGVDKPSP